MWSEWCSDCEAQVDSPHTCAGRVLTAAGIVRYDMVTNGGWTPHTSMEPADFGDYVEWDALLPIIDRLREENARLTAGLAHLTADAGPDSCADQVTRRLAAEAKLATVTAERDAAMLAHAECLTHVVGTTESNLRDEYPNTPTGSSLRGAKADQNER